MNVKRSKLWAAIFMSVIVAVSTVITAVSGINKTQAAEAQATLAVVSDPDSATGYRGDEVTVDVKISSNPGIAGLIFSVVFDNKALQLTKVNASPVIIPDQDYPDDRDMDKKVQPEVYSEAINDTSIDYVGYTFASTINFSTDETLLTLTFKILDTASTSAESTIKIAGKDGAGSAKATNASQDSVGLKVEAGFVNVLCMHEFGEWQTTPATCTVDGKHQRICSICGLTETVKIYATGHKWGDWTIVKEPTCLEEGTKEAECTVCGEKKTDAIAKSDHTYTSSVVTKEATCKDEGLLTLKCAVCGNEITKTIPKTDNHVEGAAVVTPATCTTAGKSVVSCAVCGKELSTTTIPALGHDMGTYVVTKEATCKEEGEEVSNCSRCDYKEVRAIEKKAHTAGTAKTEKEPTCTEAGESVVRCTECNEVISTTVIPAFEHNYGEAKITTESTCTKDGVNSYICSRCGSVKTEVIPALGHNFDEGRVIKEAAETEEGTLLKTCKVCGETESVVIPKLEVKTEEASTDDTSVSTQETQESIKTGDMSVNIAVLMIMLMLMSGTAVMCTRKAR